MDSICPTETYHTSAYPCIDPSLPALSSAGKNVVVTGGGSGMGPEIARAFAQSGASTIALLGRTEATLLKSKERIEAEYPTTKVTAYVADVVSASDLEEALTAHRVAHGKLHVLVANAGYLPTGRSIIDSNVEDWWTGFEVNVKGNFNLVRAFIPHAVHDAAILSNNTAAAHIPYLPGLSGYSASKMAGARLFEYLHHEYPEMFVLNIQPGAIQTAMYAKAAETGLEFPFDDVSLPASFMVWAASKEARFLNGKFVWTNWDVDELKAAALVIEGSNQYTTGLVGWQ